MEIREKEVLRYLGYRGRTPDAETLAQVQEISRQLKTLVSPKCVYKRYAITVQENTVCLDGCAMHSEKLAKHLTGCSAAYLFAVTLGVQADQLVRRLSAGNMAKGAVADAVCSAAIEGYCDEMQNTIAAAEAENGLFLKSRFSPGYGDLSLLYQREIFARLSCEKRIGVTLTDSCMMVPFKSVTAIIGVTDHPSCTYVRCSTCEKTDCTFRDNF